MDDIVNTRQFLTEEAGSLFVVIVSIGARIIANGSGDLDLINGNNPIELKHLHVHQSYCIENLILDEEGFIEIIHDVTNTSKDRIRKKLRYSQLLREVAPSLIELFLHYAISHKYEVGERTVSERVDRFCSAKDLDKVKVQQRVDALKAAIIGKIGEDQYESEIDELRAKWKYDRATLLRIVSAKDFILPLLNKKLTLMRTKAGAAFPKEYLRMRLVKSCHVENFADLKRSLDNI